MPRRSSFRQSFKTQFQEYGKVSRGDFSENLAQTGLTPYPHARKDIELLHKYIKVRFLFYMARREINAWQYFDRGFDKLGSLVIFVLNMSLSICLQDQPHTMQKVLFKKLFLSYTYYDAIETKVSLILIKGRLKYIKNPVFYTLYASHQLYHPFLGVFPVVRKNLDIFSLSHFLYDFVIIFSKRFLEWIDIKKYRCSLCIIILIIIFFDIIKLFCLIFPKQNILLLRYIDQICVTNVKHI